MSRYLVESALRDVPLPSTADRAQRQRAIFHARKIGVNLNQIAHRLNAKEPVPAEELAQGKCQDSELSLAVTESTS